MYIPLCFNRLACLLLSALLCFSAGHCYAQTMETPVAAQATDGDTAPERSFLPPEANEIHISDEQGLQLAAHLLASGETEAAMQVYSLLLQSRIAEISTEAAFVLSQIYLAAGEYDRTIEFLIGILNRFPQLPRVRLELARAYFLNKNFDDARFHFELVKGAKDIPPDVIANIDVFLQAIRRQKDWSLEIGLGYVPDSNLNQASGNDEECIRTSLGLFCRPLENRQSGHGARLNLTGNYYWKLSDSFGFRNTLGVYLTEYGKDDYDDYILYAASGPRLLFGHSEISAQPTYTRRIYGGKRYSESYGIRLDMQNDFGRVLLGSGVSFNKNVYANDYIHSRLKGQEYSIYVRPRLILNNQSFLQAGLEYTHDETASDIYGKDSWRYSLGWYYFFRYGFSLFVEGSLGTTAHHAGQYYINRNYFIDYTRRHDRIQTVNIELGTNIWEGQGFRPSLQYTYTRRDSSIWSYEYDRHRVNLLLSFRF